ncbi:MAG TPA: glycosyltransferase family 4 protein [Geobacteraceae bacterium]|nr:glycosyltransferase family 4 protein [Geobacteraceae bacterium]
MIKILHIIKTLDLGGAETNLFNLVTAFDKGSFDHHVAYSSGGEIEDRFLAEEIPLFMFAESPHKLKSPASVGIIARLALYIIRNKIDIIQSHSFNGHVWGGLAARLAGRKVIEHVHDGRYHDPADYYRRRGNFTQQRFAKYFTWLSDAVVVLTGQNRKYLIDKGLQCENKLFHIMNGIPLPQADIAVENRQRLMEKFALPHDSFVISTLSRMSAEKNIALILRIAPLVKRLIPSAVFVIAGNGPLLGDFLETALRSKAYNIRFTGFCDKPAELLSVSDLFLLPSFLELHSIALLEAMSMGIPVITSRDVGSNNDFITHKVNGFLLDPFKDDGWAETIADLWHDPDLLNSIGRSGYETCVRNFDINFTARKFENLYESLIVK